MVIISTFMQKNKEWLRERTHIFAALLLIIQPIMDVISYWCDYFAITNALTMLMRMGAMGVAMVWGYWISDRKKLYWIAAGILGMLYAGHAFACIQVGYADLVGDLSNYIRVAQMPVMMIVFTTCLRQNEKTLKWLIFGGATALMIILGVELISVVTGTDPHTYSDGAGILGWFYNTNSQSAILGMLTPFLMLWLLHRKKNGSVWFWLLTLVSCGALYMLGTRLAYASIFAATVGIAVTILLVKRKLWKHSVGLILIAVVVLAGYPYSPMVTHQAAYNEAQQNRQEETDEELGVEDEVIVDSELLGEDGEVLSPEDMAPEAYREFVEKLEPLYVKYLGDFVDIFGMEETMKMYDYTVNPFEFSNVRQKKIRFSEALMEESPFSSRLFGLELSRFTVNGNIYDVENDFHGIYFLYGYVGLGAYLLFLLYFVGIIIWALFKNFKQYFTLEAAVQGIAFCVCMAHAYNTAGVLRRPNASIYLSLVLALIYFLIFIKDYNKQK